ncbi:MAG: hypothetical protein K2P80_10010, partial [Beijerinckiaceae bacterium]|nr:hypothetical protein [Beijerinckiaceae bacterium]
IVGAEPSSAGRSWLVAQLETPPQRSATPHRPALGAIGGPAPTARPSVDAPAQSTLQSAAPVDRNAAYFNRPGAIPRTSFQPINNNAPIVKDEKPAAPTPQALQPARPVAIAPPAPPVQLQPAPKAGQLIRPQPLGPTRVLRERTRPVPGIIVPSAKVFPAHGPQPVRALSQPSQPPVAAQSSSGATGSLLPGALRPSTALSPFAQPSQPAPAQPAVRDLPNSRTPPTELGALPTVRPRPRSIMEGKKTPQKQCPAGLAVC